MKGENLIDLVFKFSFRVIEGGKDKLEFKKIRILCNMGYGLVIEVEKNHYLA